MKKVFEFLNGKKRIISIGIFIVNSGLRAFAGDLLTPEQFAFIDMAAGAIGGYGVYDANKKRKEQLRNEQQGTR